MEREDERSGLAESSELSPKVSMLFGASYRIVRKYLMLLIMRRLDAERIWLRMVVRPDRLYCGRRFRLCNQINRHSNQEKRIILCFASIL